MVRGLASAMMAELADISCGAEVPGMYEVMVCIVGGGGIYCAWYNQLEVREFERKLPKKPADRVVGERVRGRACLGMPSPFHVAVLQRTT